MAAIATSLASRFSSPTILSSSRWATLYTRLFSPRLLPSLSIAVPGVSLNLPTLDDIWESVLRAVPKNKVSHSRKRHRQMAGKALQDVNNLCKCPGCGETKRTHRLCQRCLEGTNRPCYPRMALQLVLIDFLDMKRIWREDYPTDKPF